jgi:hypothetical protein
MERGLTSERAKLFLGDGRIPLVEPCCRIEKYGTLAFVYPLENMIALFRLYLSYCRYRRLLWRFYKSGGAWKGIRRIPLAHIP